MKKIGKALEHKYFEEGKLVKKIITERDWNKVLREHLKKYYKKKKVVRIETIKNLLDEPFFRKVYFSDKTTTTFGKCAVLKNGKPSWWRTR